MAIWAASDQPFFVKGVGWRPAEALRRCDEVELCDGRVVYVGISTPVLATDQPNVGWHHNAYDSDFGMLADFSDAPRAIDGWAEKPMSAEDGIPFLAEVHTLSVGRPCTYCVGPWHVRTKAAE